MPLFKNLWDISQDLLDDLRTRFLNEVQSSPEEAEKYHPLDVDRVRNNDWFIARYILHQERDIDQALKMLKESLKFRKEFDLNTLSKEDLPQDWIDARTTAIYNKDNKGCPILILRCKQHTKDTGPRRLQKQYFLYFLEQAARISDWGAVSIIFDLTDTGYKNMDMEMNRFILSVFKQYYPWGLNFFMVYNLPWYLSAMWKIIKTWIPENHVNRIVFVDSKTIKGYVDEDQLPVVMGGTCTDQFGPKIEEEPRRSGWL